MRHLNKGRKLDRTAAPRKALLRNLATSLVLYEKVKTTKAKAKELKTVIEPLITLSKKNNLTSRRRLLAYLTHGNAVDKMLEVIGPRYLERKGGYTRITALGQRKGDAAEVVYIELV